MIEEDSDLSQRTDAFRLGRPSNSQGDARRSQRFEELVASHGQGLLDLARRVLGDREEARDVRQVAFLRLWGALEELEPGREGPWVHRVVLNLCRDRSRSVRVRQQYSNAFESGVAPAADAPAREREVERSVSEAVRALPEEERDVVLLKHYGGLTFRAVADALQVPVTTVKSRLQRALERLRVPLREFSP